MVLIKTASEATRGQQGPSARAPRHLLSYPWPGAKGILGCREHTLQLMKLPGTAGPVSL